MTITCPHCGQPAATLHPWTIPGSEPAEPLEYRAENPPVEYREEIPSEPIQDPTPEKLDELKASRPARRHAITADLELQIRQLLAFEPDLTGKEIAIRTDGKQSTVYNVLKKIRAERAVDEVIAEIAAADERITIEELAAGCATAAA